MRKICVSILSRANYGRIKSCMHAIKAHPDLELQVVVGASASLERFGNAAKIILSDGFKIDKVVNFALEGDEPHLMAKTCGLGIIELASVFNDLQPDVVVTVADRYETMATSIAASYQNIVLAHIQGGEVTGSIDESVRHSITKLAHIHFPATKRSADFIERMGEDPNYIKNVGCPSIDEIVNGKTHKLHSLEKIGTGYNIDLSKKYIVVVFHPVTTEHMNAFEQTKQLLNFVVEIDIQTVWLWPNIDAGTDNISKALRVFREQNPSNKIKFIKNLHVRDYNKLLENACCLVGNSSSFIREGSFLGTPAVIVGSRQNNREIGKNAIFCDIKVEDILRAYKNRLNWSREKDFLYGSGDAGGKIANFLSKKLPPVQKIINYV